MTRLAFHIAATAARRFLPLLAVAIVGVMTAVAQVSPSLYDYARPGLDWYDLETEHFHVLFHADTTGQGSSRTAQVVARIAEEVYGPITALYDHEPDTKVSFILKDFEDYSNGAAYFFDNKIEIWAPALDSPLRGDHNWLRNVITHEFTHIVQVQAAMKSGRRLPLYYFQLLDYEDVKRPDVLYGYPDVIVTYPVPVVNNPAWFAEGTAQYQRAFLGYDGWDTHRDMLLRTRVLAGEELSLEEMGGFYSHSSLLREGVYNHGFAFTQYLAAMYGEEVLPRLTRSLGDWSNWNVDRAFRDAIGLDGDDVYGAWMDSLRATYMKRTAAIREHEVAGRLVEKSGFSNLYPSFSPEGRRLAYVSNRGEDFSLTSLYVVDLDTGAETAHAIEGLGGGAGYTCSLGHHHRVQENVGGALTWRPDGGAIVYARVKDTPEGYRFSDLYELDLETEKERRLTDERRAASPAFSPDGDELAFVVQEDGTTNLFVLDVATAAPQRLTDYADGTQISGPAWHPSGEWIYFARRRDGSRDLYRVARSGGEAEPVVATEADERNPSFGPDGTYLYYASDASGIFNLYRIRRDPSAEARPERLTNVLGGAFMPSISSTGELAFAQYQWDGYKIAMLDAPLVLEGPAATARYSPPEINLKQEEPLLARADWGGLNEFDDTDLGPLPGHAVTAVRTEGNFPLEAGGSVEQRESSRREVRPYGSLFTSFSIYPVLRLDQYVNRRRATLDARLTQRTRLGTLARNAKIGLYASSREVLEEMTLFGGVLVGPGSRDASSVSDFFSPSRLLKLERDAFLSFEYRKGLPFIPKRWSPQLAVELFNIRRNVENGLTLEEFPCTACFPDTTLADLSYSLWEAGLYARSKINRYLLAEVGYRYSPYRVLTERFFSRELDAFVPENGSRYFIGRAYLANLYFELMHPHRDSDVVPEGVRAEARYEYERGRLLDRFALDDGILVPEYEQYRNHRVTLDARIGLRLPNRPLGGTHGIGARLRASTLLGAPVDDFFNDYVGGLIGARGYPFYALGGNETLWLQASYTFPLVPDIHRQVLFTYVDKIYARIYGDAAWAWSGAWPGLDGARRDLGAELRVALGSFYLFPTSVFVSGTYGFDQFDFQLDEGFVTPDGRSIVRYGGELNWHFGVLFGFDL